MADYVELLKSDLIEQFKDKTIIGCLMEAVGEQMNELYAFFSALQDERWIDAAVGKQLEYVGDIVCLSRMEAGELACSTESSYVMDDDTYRLYLYYKLWHNTNNCTYRDVLKALNMFWPYALYYSEDPEQPATMIFDTGEISDDIDIVPLWSIPLVRAAGVKILIYATTKRDIEQTIDVHYGTLISPWSCHPLPNHDDQVTLGGFILDEDRLADDEGNYIATDAEVGLLDEFIIDVDLMAELGTTDSSDSDADSGSSDDTESDDTDSGDTGSEETDDTDDTTSEEDDDETENSSGLTGELDAFELNDNVLADD